MLWTANQALRRFSTTSVSSAASPASVLSIVSQYGFPVNSKKLQTNYEAMEGRGYVKDARFGSEGGPVGHT